MRDEIWAGLKNAIERGEPIDKAVQSFISAGYNAEEVKEAAKGISSGASAIITEPKPKEEIKQPEKKQILPEQYRDKSEANTGNLQSISLAKPPAELAAKEMKVDNTKVLYVPGSEGYGVQQIPNNVPIAQMQRYNTDYIPYGGVNSTRKKRIIWLTVFLIVLVILLALGIFYIDKIIEMIKSILS